MNQSTCIQRFIEGKRGTASNMLSDGEIIWADSGTWGTPAAMHLPGGSFLVNEGWHAKAGPRIRYVIRAINALPEKKIYKCNEKEFKEYIRTRSPVILKMRRKGAKDIPEMVGDLMGLDLLPRHRFPRKRFETLIKDEVAYIQLRQAVNRGTFPSGFRLEAVGQFRFKDAYDVLIEASRRGNRDAALNLMRTSLGRLKDGGVDLTIARNMKSMARALKKGMENYYGCLVTYEIFHLRLWDEKLRAVQAGNTREIYLSELEKLLSHPGAKTTITPKILEEIKTDLVLEGL